MSFFANLDERIHKLEKLYCALDDRVKSLEASSSPLTVARASTPAAAAMARAEAERRLREAPPFSAPLGLPLRDVVRGYVAATLEAVGGSKTVASEVLKVARRTLYNWEAYLSKLGQEKP